MTGLELQALAQIRSAGLPEPEREYRFDPARRWRADFAWPDSKILLEVEGGTWIRGRHTRGKGFERDCEKYNAAAAQGWRVFRFTSGMLDQGILPIVLEAVL